MCIHFARDLKWIQTFCYIGGYEFTLSIIFIKIGFYGAAVLFTCLLAYYAFMSQYIIDEVNDLINTLENLPINDIMIETAQMNGEQHPPMYAR